MNIDYKHKITFESILKKHSKEKALNYQRGFDKIIATRKIPT